MSQKMILVTLIASLTAAGAGPRLRVWAGGRYNSGRPAQFFSWTSGDRAGGYGTMIGIAHNAGDDPLTVQQSLASGASFIEIDVVHQDGVLYAAHTAPAGTMKSWSWWIAPPLTLDDAWGMSLRAAGIELDVKDSSPSTIKAVVGFLERKRDNRPILVASKDANALASIHERAPSALLLLSIDTPASMLAFQHNAAEASGLTGVTVRDSLLDAATVQTLKKQGLVVLGWTVNDPVRLDQLIDLGVDGVATDNLAIMERLRAGTVRWSGVVPA